MSDNTNITMSTTHLHNTELAAGGVDFMFCEHPTDKKRALATTKDEFESVFCKYPEKSAEGAVKAFVQDHPYASFFKISAAPYANVKGDIQMDFFNRPQIESDLGRVQFIPYTALVNKADQTVLLYTRGQGSGEERLSGKASIGVGGHMEIDPDHNLWMQGMWSRRMMIKLSYDSLVLESLKRELQEETGVTLESGAELAQWPSGQQFKLFYADNTAVNAVHAGLMSVIFVDKVQDLAIKPQAGEEDVVTQYEWVKISELQAHCKAKGAELELWSEAMLALLSDALPKWTA